MIQISPGGTFHSKLLPWPWPLSLTVLAGDSGGLVLRHQRTLMHMNEWEQITFHPMSRKLQWGQAPPDLRPDQLSRRRMCRNQGGVYMRPQTAPSRPGVSTEPGNQPQPRSASLLLRGLGSLRCGASCPARPHASVWGGAGSSVLSPPNWTRFLLAPCSGRPSMTTRQCCHCNHLPRSAEVSLPWVVGPEQPTCICFSARSAGSHFGSRTNGT